MALKFLNKKGWHSGSLRNIENVWKAEQKKLEELRKQIVEEREHSEFRDLQVQAGLVPSSEAWHSKRPLLVEAVKSLLDEQNLGVRKALLELIVVMASHCYLVGPSGELFVEYLVRHCAISEDCTCRVWGLDGKQIKMIKEHIGRGVWRCLYDPDSSILVTAGFDSAIKVHHLQASLPQSWEGKKSFNEKTVIVTGQIPNLTEHNGLMNSLDIILANERRASLVRRIISASLGGSSPSNLRKSLISFNLRSSDNTSTSPSLLQLAKLIHLGAVTTLLLLLSLLQLSLLIFFLVYPYMWRGIGMA